MEFLQIPARIGHAIAGTLHPRNYFLGYFGRSISVGLFWVENHVPTKLRHPLEATPTMRMGLDLVLRGASSPVGS